MGPGVLCPRADTETLIDKSLEFLKERKNPDVLDLCAGSGCIGITLAKQVPEAAVTMVEKFPEAAGYAEKNIVRNSADNVRLITGDIFESAGADKKYDLIVSNPPYIPENEMDTVSPETKYEPETALKGGKDGLDFYRAIIKNYKSSLKEGGMAAFEVGAGEAETVETLLKDAGFKDTGTVNDLNGIKRVVFALL